MRLDRPRELLVAAELVEAVDIPERVAEFARLGVVHESPLGFRGFVLEAGLDADALCRLADDDVVLEVTRENEIVETYGEPDDHTIMSEQHNPNVLAGSGTMLVADSENNRIVELDTETETVTVVGRYERVPASSGVEPRSLQWPRDADRLPGGNTLITDSRRYRVLEVRPDGTIAWSFNSRTALGEKAIIYEADRIRLNDGYLPEEPSGVRSGETLESQTEGPLAGAYATADSWLAFVLPAWMGPLSALVALGDALAGLLLARELR